MFAVVVAFTNTAMGTHTRPIPFLLVGCGWDGNIATVVAVAHLSSGVFLGSIEMTVTG